MMQRARDPSTTSVAHAIRRGSIKISWPIPAAGDADVASPIASPQTAAVVTSPHGAKPPSRPARPDSPTAAATLNSGYDDIGPATDAHSAAVHDAPDRTPVRASTAPDPVQPAPVSPQSQAARADRLTRATAPVSPPSDPPQKKQKKRSVGGVKSMIRRLLRRSTVKESRTPSTSGPARQSVVEAARSSQLRSVSIDF